MLGRPSKYNSKYCKEVIKMMSEGHSKEATAAKLGISRDTLYTWCKAHTDFSDSIKIGEAKSLLYWEQIGIDGMQGKLKNFRAVIWIFIMKNRFGWRDNSSESVEKLFPEHDMSSDMANKTILSDLLDKYNRQPHVSLASSSN